MKTLDDVFPDVIQCMCESAELEPYEEQCWATFEYLDNGYHIKGEVFLTGEWHTDGDGYDAPVELYFSNGKGCIEMLYIALYNEDTEEEIPFTYSETTKYADKLQLKLSKHMAK